MSSKLLQEQSILLEINLVHRQFKEFFEDTDRKLDNVVSLCPYLLVQCGKRVKNVFNLWEEIDISLSGNNFVISEFKNKERFYYLAFFLLISCII